MLDVTAHMLQLLQHAQLKDERPEDESFLPLSLTLACLLRQLPPGLAPPSGVFSFHQLDRLPPQLLQHKLEKLLAGGGGSGGGEPAKALAFVSSIVQYVRLTRALLTVCYEHLANQKTALEATQDVVAVVVDALGADEEVDEDISDNETDGDAVADEAEAHASARSARTTKETAPPSPLRQQSRNDSSKLDPVPTTLRAVSASEVMKRAVSRDAGDGRAVVEIMRKYPADERIQAKGVRALKLVVRKLVGSESTDVDSGRETSGAPDPRHDRRERRSSRSRRRQKAARADDDSSGGSSSDSSSNDTDGAGSSPGAALETVPLREAVELVVNNMQKHADNLLLQRDALLCLSEYVNMDARYVVVIAASGGIASVMDAMALLPDDQAASVGALSVLAHPLIAGTDGRQISSMHRSCSPSLVAPDESVLRVNPESRRLVLSAMKRFPLNEQLQGLGCLALANLSLRHGT